MIDERAIIHPTARIARDVRIGPWTIIGADVEIGEGTWIGPHVVINGPTKIGKNNQIFQFCSLGEQPQDKKFHDEPTTLEIGDNNTIREFCTFNRGTVQGGGVTKVGNNNWIMAYVHIAHDCIVGNNTTFANNASLAGHVTVEDFVTFAGFAGVHQFCRVGRYSFVAKATYVTQDVLPYILVSGYNPEACGLNTEGLKRNGFSPETIDTLKRAYRLIFRQGLTTKEAIVELQKIKHDGPEIERLIQAMQSATRGIVR